MKAIQDLGGLVLLETDARELHTHPIISQYKYARIIFNFPLADRHNIKKNRALLADFFASCASILSEDGQIMVTLCKGQGGTPADNPMRSWHDSWQVVAMATNSGFLLTDVMLFDATKYPEYHSVGFRFQDKSFNTGGGLTHVFERAPLVEVGEAVARTSILCGDVAYSCSSYIADRRKRNLLHEANNPVSLVCRVLKQTVSQNLELDCKDVEDDFLFVKGHRSRAVVNLCQPCAGSSTLTGSSARQLDVDDEGTVEQKTVKEKKEEFNVTLQNKEKLSSNTLAHGIVQDKTTPTERLHEHHDDVSTTFSQLGLILPSEPEAVYSAIKRTPKSCQGADGDSACQEGVHELSGDAEMKSETLEEDPSQRVFHLRTSLLEVAGDLWSHSVADSSSVGTASSVLGTDGSVGQGRGKCVAFTGQCYQPCDVRPGHLPVTHELLMIHGPGGVVERSTLFDSPKDSSCTDGHSSPPNETLATYSSFDKDKLIPDSVLSKVIAACNTSSLCSDWCFEVRPADQTCEVLIESLDSVTDLKTVQLRRQCREDDTEKFDKTVCTVGLLCSADVCGQKCEICLLSLDNIAGAVCSLPNSRLLWSLRDKFTQQFHASGFPHVYQPFSLFPMKLVHDLSFWLKDSEETVDEYELADAVRCVAGDFVVRVQLIDTYQDQESGQRSRCYRLHFLSHDQALPYLTSWKLQSLIRMEVARRMGVTLR
ncbi:uncharacterized protein LOC101851021 isoform X2 [Aplysia californica]|nr:uncharacterized protein LOC101851021 isoform X2 [Aplysia californica]